MSPSSSGSSRPSRCTCPPHTGGPQDPYEVLGLFPGASIAQVKRAHRNLAKQYHPDRFGNTSDAERREAEQKMVQVNGAYAELVSHVAPTGPLLAPPRASLDCGTNQGTWRAV